MNEDAIFIASAYAPLGSGLGTYAGIVALEKSSLLGGGAATKVYEEFTASDPVFPLNQVTSGSTQYFAETGPSGSSLVLHSVTDVLTTANRASLNIPVPTFAEPVDIPQPGTNVPVTGQDSQIVSGVWRNGSAWLAHSITDPSIGGENVVRWYQLATNNFPTNGPALVQSGNVDPGQGLHAWAPAIGVGNANNMALSFSVGGSSQFYGAGFTGRRPVDPLGATRTPVVDFAEGAAPYVVPGSTGQNQWARYNGLALDPEDGATFWVLSPFANSVNAWGHQVRGNPNGSVPRFRFLHRDCAGQ